MPILRTFAARWSKRATSTGASEQLHQQRSADIERLIHHGIHLRVSIHRFAGDVAQACAEAPSREDEQRQDRDADECQAPLQAKRHRQHRRRLNDIRDDTDDRVADGVLGTDDIVVQAAHQLADFSIGEEAQRHFLQMGVQGHTQIIDHPFAHGGIEPPLPEVDRGAHNWDEQQAEGQQPQALQVAVREGAIDGIAHNQGCEQPQAAGDRDNDQHSCDLGAIGAAISQYTPQQAPGDLGFLVVGDTELSHPAATMHHHD
jgi:hypothetical protein